jgi:hypothetical protein
LSDLSPATHDAPAAARHPLAALHDPATIRLRCAAVLRSVEAGVSPSFLLRRERLADAADRVAALTRARSPSLQVPPHSRWRHFEAGGVDRKAELDALLAGRSAAERARAHFDLAVVSVLLDAGAGARWRYTEEATGLAFTRSEGLGVASFRAFLAGVFSATEGDPLRADASALARLDAGTLRRVFHSSADNPMVGLEGRAALLSRLGETLQEVAALTGQAGRPGLIFDRLTARGTLPSASATALLRELLILLAPAWPSGSRVLGLPAGDVWPHRWAGMASAGGTDRMTEGHVPFHKLSQWLAYSLIEPLQWAGVAVSGIEALTGLPEYRNGGLLIDAGVLAPRDARLLARTWKPADELIIEWRACTVVLLDELATLVRQRLGVDEAALPLASVLEGGTWAAGRELAAELREGGAPPLRIDSDGTLF